MLSIAINVKNGEKHLAKCLDALTRFTDIVLMDNHSTDKTITIADSYPNVRIITHDFCGMGKVRNILSTYAKNDWIFFVDSDEIISSKLVDQLLNMQFCHGHVYSLQRHNFYANYFVDSSSWGGDWVNRIYNRCETKYLEVDVHENVDTTNLVVKKISSGFIYHFPYESVTELIDKMQFYSTLYARQNFRQKKVKLFSIPLRALIMFIKCYFLKSGFKDGFPGFAISSFNAIGVFAKYIKLYELSYKRKVGLALSLSFTDMEHVITELSKLIEQINTQTLLPHRVLFFVMHKIPANPDSVSAKLIDLAAMDSIIKQIELLLKERLVVTSKVIRVDSEDLLDKIGNIKCDAEIKNLINENLAKNDDLDNIIYVKNPSMLSKQKLFKKYRALVLQSKLLTQIEIFTKL